MDARKRYARSRLTRGRGRIPSAGNGARAEIVGERERPGAGKTAFRWRSGVLTTLPPLTGAVSSAAFACLLDGPAVGYSVTRSGERRAVRWNADHMPVALPQLSERGRSEASAIAAGGAIAGRATGRDKRWHAVIWMQGRIHDLGVLSTHTHARACAVNAAGHVAGFGFDDENASDTATSAFRWTQSGGMEHLGTLTDADDSRASAINVRGDIVGTSGGRAFLWTEREGLIDLNSLLPGRYGWVLRGAEGISDDGRIVGSGTHDGRERAFLLTPRSETP